MIMQIYKTWKDNALYAGISPNAIYGSARGDRGDRVTANRHATVSYKAARSQDWPVNRPISWSRLTDVRE
jgi:hypothetical protein